MSKPCTGGKILWMVVDSTKPHGMKPRTDPHMPEVDAGYTVFMTKGSHVVSSAMAMLILGAVKAGKTDVTIEVDVMGSSRPIEMTLVTAHVVSLMKHNAEADVDFANVRHLRR